MHIAEAIMESLFGFAFLSNTEDFIPLVALPLVFGIPIVAIVVDYLQKRNKNRVIERALERGVPIENLALDEPRRNRMPYRSGMVMLAVGIGVAIFGFAFGKALEAGGDPEFYVPRAIFGAGGAIVFLIGVALLINDRMNRDRFDNGKD
jgi:MFS family permease